MTASALDITRLCSAYEQVRDELLAERTPNGHWVGELSSSALSTATAVSALAVVHRVGWDKAAAAAVPPSINMEGGTALADSLVPPYGLEDLIRRGVGYLAEQQNPDGGFGDTDLSHSNIATTYLVVAALHLAGVADAHSDLLGRANAYIDSKNGLTGLRERYGIDKTFVVPIMTNLALAGLLDWREIDALPFELACVPQSFYRFVGMPVVSYAIPALVAIGQARYHHAPPRNPVTRLIRWLSISRSLKVLRQMQPDSGGYLEATPLTSFVVMSLASCPPLRGGSPAMESRAAVIREGVKFLAASVRPDGSWPIDTNLATWNTTLAINALAGAGEDVAALLGPQCLDWLLSCQHTKRHRFTGADPGGFGWSDLSGAVPDADDTPGAMLSMLEFAADVIGDQLWSKRNASGAAALRWLRALQNRDGGWPTFCRGWGRLPFDRSGTDLTAHALRAFGPWVGMNLMANYLENLAAPVNPIQGLQAEERRGLAFLSKSQHSDGSWSPLWFGNQDHPQEGNPVYGTAKVLMAYRDLGLMDSPEARRGVAWLVANQNADGGWGSGVWGRATKLRIVDCGLRIGTEVGGEARSTEYPVPSTQYRIPSTLSDDAAGSPIRNPQSAIHNLQSSVEETALAVEALLAALPLNPEPRTLNPGNATEGVPYSAEVVTAVTRGLNWLLDRVEAGQHRQPAPIGFYFAKLWYYERLYPLTFTVAALGRACRQFARHVQLDSHSDPASARAP